MPLFPGAVNAANTVILLSDSSDDEDLHIVSTFARRQADDEEKQISKKPVAQKKMPPPFMSLGGTRVLTRPTRMLFTSGAATASEASGMASVATSSF